MSSVLGRRLLQSLVTLIVSVFLVFVMFSVIPGTFANAIGGEKRAISAEVKEKLRAELHLDEPAPLRFVHYVGGLVRGDLGNSFAMRRPVSGILAERLVASVRLACAAIGFAVVFGVPMGFLAAARKGTWIDATVMLLAISGLSLPGFWFGLLAMYLFALELHWLPTIGYGHGDLAHLVLPAMTLGIAPLALIARTTRAAVLQVMSEDYIRTARSKGASEPRVALRHMARNAFVLILTTIGLQFGSMLGGSVIVENLFSWPGIGALLTQSVAQRDIPLVQGCVLLIIFFFLVINTLVDLAYIAIDPRIRYS